MVCCISEEQLKLVYEDSEGFAPLPTFAAIAAHPALNSVPLEHWIPGCVKVGASRFEVMQCTAPSGHQAESLQEECHWRRKAHLV